MPYPLLIPSTVSQVELPSYHFELKDNEEGNEVRRLLETDEGQGGNFTLVYTALPSAQVEELVNFYRQSYRQNRAFGVPLEVLQYPGVLGIAIGQFFVGCLFNFEEPPVVRTVVEGLYAVTLKLRATTIYLSAGANVNLVAQSSYTLTGITNVPLDTVWTQVSGSPVIIDNPYSLVTDIRSNSGYFNSSQGMVVFRLAAVSDPSLYDEVALIVTPTSSVRHFSVVKGYPVINSDPLLLPSEQLKVRLGSPQGSFPYGWNAVGTYNQDSPTVPVTWNLPTYAPGNLLGIEWQQLVDGDFQTVAYFPTSADRLFNAVKRNYYRLVSVYEFNTKRHYGYSSTIYLKSECLLTSLQSNLAHESVPHLSVSHTYPVVKYSRTTKLSYEEVAGYYQLSTKAPIIDRNSFVILNYSDIANAHQVYSRFPVVVKQAFTGGIIG